MRWTCHRKAAAARLSASLSASLDRTLAGAALLANEE